MKSILLFRHGKTNFNINYLNDYERTLSNKGIQDSEKMGLYVSNKNIIPDLVISSTAKRAKHTANLSINSGKWDTVLEFEAGIYKGDSDFLLNLIRIQKNKFNLICLVGHQPYCSEFIYKSTGNKYLNFSTASMAKIDYKINYWEEIDSSVGILDWFIQPQDVILKDLL